MRFFSSPWRRDYPYQNCIQGRGFARCLVPVAVPKSVIWARCDLPGAGCLLSGVAYTTDSSRLLEAGQGIEFDATRWFASMAFASMGPPPFKREHNAEGLKCKSLEM